MEKHHGVGSLEKNNCNEAQATPAQCVRWSGIYISSSTYSHKVVNTIVHIPQARLRKGNPSTATSTCTLTIHNHNLSNLNTSTSTTSTPSPPSFSPPSSPLPPQSSPFV